MKNVIDTLRTRRSEEDNQKMKTWLDEFNKMTVEEREQIKCDWYNETPGDLHLKDGIECDECKNKGYIHIYLNGEIMARECKCMKKRKVIRKAKNSGLGDYLNKRAKDYLVTQSWQEQNKSVMIKYCSLNPTNWFITCGQSGSGKTLMCSIIANNLLFNLGQEVIYITWTDFISRLKRDMMSDNTEEVNKYLDEIKNVEILFIDELLKKYNETDLKYIIEIINYRYQNDKKTIITSENSIDDLLNIDEATFGRVIEKCGEFVLEIEKDRAKNYRLRNLKR